MVNCNSKKGNEIFRTPWKSCNQKRINDDIPTPKETIIRLQNVLPFLNQQLTISGITKRRRQTARSSLDSHPHAQWSIKNEKMGVIG